MTFNTYEEKCQIKTVEKALKSLSESQWYTVDIKSLNVYAFSLRTHLSDILNLEEEMKEELMSVNAVHQQFNKVMLW